MSVDLSAILVVEPYEALREALVAWLKGMLPTARVVSAESGEAAVASCAVEPPGVVIIDAVLPGINIIETIRRVKSMSPETRVIVIATLNDPATENAAIAVGADAYLTKQRIDLELLGVIQSLVG